MGSKVRICLLGLGERGEAVGAADCRGAVRRGQGDVAAAGFLDLDSLLQADPVGPVAGVGGDPAEIAHDEGVAVGEPGPLGVVEPGEEAGHRPYGGIRGRYRAAVDPGRGPGGEARGPQRGAALGAVHGRPAGGRQQDEDHREREQGAQGGGARVGAGGGGVGKA